MNECDEVKPMVREPNERNIFALNSFGLNQTFGQSDKESGLTAWNQQPAYNTQNHPASKFRQAYHRTVPINLNKT